jgi:2-keto-3-deoxy-L-rhamnonate aldolase RhmA
VLEAPLQLVLFSHDLDYAAAATTAGMNSIVVDWEWSGKSVRQFGFATEINRGTEADLISMRRRIQGNLICRINNGPNQRVREALRAAELGADEIWLPMVRSVSEVEECIAALMRVEHPVRDCAGDDIGEGMGAASVVTCVHRAE